MANPEHIKVFKPSNPEVGHPLERSRCHPKTGQRFYVKGEEYTLGGVIGDGAAGLVRKATKVLDNSPRAIKFLAPDSKYIEEDAFDDVAIRFRREGERGVKLNHRNLMAIYAYCDNEDGSAFETKEPKNPFLLMEQIKGRTLERYILNCRNEEESEFDITRERLHIGIQIVSALEDLHKKKLIHRDVKPANIFLSQTSDQMQFPYVKLGDFGIMKWGDFYASLSTGALTATHQKGLGTLKYMSPEQALAPKTITVRSDMYSLGITLFELFTGQILATPHHVFEIMNARLLRGNTTSRLYSMGYRLNLEDEGIAGLLLDMHLRGVMGRPTIDKVRGRMEHEYEARYEVNWESDLV